MKICDNNWDDPSGGHTVETWDSNQSGCLALCITDQFDSDKYQTATLTPEACLALGMVLLNHAIANGMSVPRLE